MGEYEGAAGFEQLVAALKDLKVNNLTIETRMIQGSGHAGTKPEGYNKGLQYVFSRPCLGVDPKILERYKGEYELSPQFVIKMLIENGKPMALLPSGEKISVCAETEKDFYITGAFLKIRFIEDEQGRVTGFKMVQYNGENFAKKIK